MCKASDDMMTDAREEGRQEALTGLQDMMEDAREEERRNIIRILVKDYRQSGYSQEMIIRKLETLFSLPPEAAENYFG